MNSLKIYTFLYWTGYGKRICIFRKDLTQLKRKVYLMEASIIPLCLQVFDWAKFRSIKGTVKLHTVLDYEGCLPVFMQITDRKVHERQLANSILDYVEWQHISAIKKDLFNQYTYWASDVVILADQAIDLNLIFH